jgi:4-amino-4-deoxy-L-arabinose transferase-like glycosyltransferase
MMQSATEIRPPWASKTLHRVLICLVFAAALTPVIPWVQFSGGMENFNVATALESQRDHHWLMPYLGMEPRAAKPPLLHWITAVGIELIPNSLAWGSRGASILASCAMLVAVYELGRVLLDWRLGLVGAFCCGTTILFLKFAWQASYDLHLALWVTVTNWCLAMALLKNMRWRGCLGAGVALGLALMVKGPVAILQTVVPWVAFLAWRRWREKSSGQSPVAFSPSRCTQGEGRGGGLLVAPAPIADQKNPSPYPSPAVPGEGTGWSLPLLAGTALTLLVALPWTLYAMWLNRHMLGLIYNEVSLGTEAEYETRIRWHGYIVFFPLMLPWLIWFITGFIQIIRDGRKASGLVLAIFWLVLPIAVMTFFPERRDRYLLPMAGAAALIAAYGVLSHVPRWGRWNATQKWLLILHAIPLAVLAIGLPIYGAIALRTVDGQPWYTPSFAAAVIAIAWVISAVGIAVYRKSRGGFVGGTVALMLLANITFLWGYKDSASGRSQGKVFAAEILDAYPDARVYNAAPRRRKFLPLELLIYLNRDVAPLANPAALAPADAPQVLIYPPAEKGDAIDQVPPGFHEFVNCKINTGVYHAFVQDKR